MDWQLVGLTGLFVTPSLLVGLVGLLGFTRTEKLLGAAYYAGFAALILLAVLDESLSSGAADLGTKADIDSWMARKHGVYRAANGVIWFCISAATAFCVLALVHIWRERSTLWKKLQVKSVISGRTGPPT